MSKQVRGFLSTEKAACRADSSSPLRVCSFLTHIIFCTKTLLIICISYTYRLMYNAQELSQTFVDQIELGKEVASKDIKGITPILSQRLYECIIGTRTQQRRSSRCNGPSNGRRGRAPHSRRPQFGGLLGSIRYPLRVLSELFV